ncbi:WhiB family transcriptional regulator [Streptomyces sp. NPDC098789]|uniref:WhiB family transcriptional regulator n=1 Tax=Streptomyces sp. NPDC098789 TaxID=3366098 RepID=UPI00381520FE
MSARHSLPSFVPPTDHVGVLPCAEPGVDPDRVFFSDTSSNLPLKAALLMCERCPVRFACQDHARNQREWGIWGGEPESAREAPPAGRSSSRRRAALRLRPAPTPTAQRPGDDARGNG